jgi:hypothetical protein
MRPFRPMRWGRQKVDATIDRLATAMASRVGSKLEAQTAAPTPDGAIPAGLVIDYPPHPRPRFGAIYGLADHPQLSALFESRRSIFADEIDDIQSYAKQLEAIDRDAPDSSQPSWLNPFIPGLDGACLYALVAKRNPAVYFEIGSGNSTKFVRRSINDNGLRTRIVSIDPAPRAEVDAICDEMIRSPFEDVDLAWVDRLQRGDVVFVDNSHRCFQNSDATVVFTEVFPRLPHGISVGIHDIFLPADYPPDWVDRYYSEQYLLMSWLLAGAGGMEVTFPAYFASIDQELSTRMRPLWDSPRFEGVQRHGNSFWLAT